MKKLFRKNNLSSSQSATLPSHRAQVAWSLFVAVAMAIMALRQVNGARRENARSPAAHTSAPQTLVTGKPVPLSQEDLNTPENQIQ